MSEKKQHVIESVTRIGKGGRVVIPAEVRRRMGVQEGDDVVLRLEGEELRIFTPRQAVRSAQARVRRYVPAGVSLVDELLAERRREAADE